MDQKNDQMGNFWLILVIDQLCDKKEAINLALNKS